MLKGHVEIDELSSAAIARPAVLARREQNDCARIEERGGRIAPKTTPNRKNGAAPCILETMESGSAVSTDETAFNN